MNKSILIGRVGRDPERVADTVLKFSLATTERWKNKEGEKQERTDWHNVTAYGRTADTLEKYLTKGDLVYIEGKSRVDSYETKEGEKRKAYYTEVRGFEFLRLNSKASEAPQQTNDYDHGLPF